MALLSLGINHLTAPVDIREKVAFAPEQMSQALHELQDIPAINPGPRSEAAQARFVIRPALTYFPTVRQYHRPRRLNGRVRNGIGWNPSGMDTGQKW